ncbi:hypothetical protein ACP3P8_05030 [Pseudomonas aeruginosa]
MTGSEFLVVVPPVGPAVVVDASIPQHPRRRELGNGSEAPGRRGRESRPGVRFLYPALWAGKEEGGGEHRSSPTVPLPEPFEKGFAARAVTARADCGSLVADREAGHVPRPLISAEWSQLLPPMAAQVLNTCWALAVL